MIEALLIGLGVFHVALVVALVVEGHLLARDVEKLIRLLLRGRR